MKKFKEHWNIKQNWQLLFPFLGLLVLTYSSYKLANALINNSNISWVILFAIVIFFVLLKFTLFLFKKLESKWDLQYKWEFISIFLVFAVTGTSSIFIARPIIKLIGITKENLNLFAYWFLYIIIGFIFYQILLVLIGWLFGQFKFFWKFEKKMLCRLGLKRFLD
ncbi:DUF6787 family protein [Gaetbulibacter aquiaggeris]|uniref:DUF6787 family protein n=1 Tax=Gaetbulibacter aquiaggeris TaxID=1735373 RepID=A0ABW7MTJ9_9FLAO